MYKYLKIVLLVYLILMNLIGFASMGIDKRKAVKHQWRIKEATLFLIAIVGGSIGSNLGMQVFRHKTKHTKFVVGMPMILTIHLAIACYVYVQYIL